MGSLFSRLRSSLFTGVVNKPDGSFFFFFIKTSFQKQHCIFTFSGTEIKASLFLKTTCIRVPLNNESS